MILEAVAVVAASLIVVCVFAGAMWVLTSSKRVEREIAAEVARRDRSRPVGSYPVTISADTRAFRRGVEKAHGQGGAS